jgi:hypothetical protein
MKLQKKILNRLKSATPREWQVASVIFLGIHGEMVGEDLFNKNYTGVLIKIIVGALGTICLNLAIKTPSKTKETEKGEK